jgi:hypothetical protein
MSRNVKTAFFWDAMLYNVVDGYQLLKGPAICRPFVNHLPDYAIKSQKTTLLNKSDVAINTSYHMGLNPSTQR